MRVFDVYKKRIFKSDKISSFRVFTIFSTISMRGSFFHIERNWKQKQKQKIEKDWLTSKSSQVASPKIASCHVRNISNKYDIKILNDYLCCILFLSFLSLRYRSKSNIKYYPLLNLILDFERSEFIILNSRRKTINVRKKSFVEDIWTHTKSKRRIWKKKKMRI